VAVGLIGGTGIGIGIMGGADVGIGNVGGGGVASGSFEAQVHCFSSAATGLLEGHKGQCQGMGGRCHSHHPSQQSIVPLQS
jgi:hypothetical protein